VGKAVVPRRRNSETGFFEEESKKGTRQFQRRTSTKEGKSG
jgi:hypothetical protein